MKPTGAARSRHGLDLLRELSHRHDAPTGVHLQIADRCNHTCAHCYQIQGLKGELSLDEIFALLDDLADAGVLSLNVSGGEATLRPDLLDILRYARQKGFAVRLYTNAFLVNDAMARTLAEIGLLDVHVSLYSHIPAHHDAVTCVPGSHARTLQGVRAMRAHGLRVTLKAPALTLCPGGPVGVEVIANELGCGFVGSTEITPMEDGSMRSREAASSTRALLDMGMLEPWVPSPDDDRKRAAKLAGAPCGVGTSGVVILPNGDVLPCTDTIVPLGNLTRSPFKTILAERSETALFRSLTWASVHGCRDCDLILACRRCHATAAHQAGDYLGPYPAACERARSRYEAGVGSLTVLPPTAECDPARDPALGPYKIEAPGRLRPIADLRSDDDEATAAKHPWIRGMSGSPHTPADGGRNPALVELKRKVPANRAS